MRSSAGAIAAIGGVALKQAVLDARVKEGNGALVIRNDPEWDEFRRVQMQWFPKVSPIQFWLKHLRGGVKSKI
jgi:hypothetical protein